MVDAQTFQKRVDDYNSKPKMTLEDRVSRLEKLVILAIFTNLPDILALIASFF